MPAWAQEGGDEAMRARLRDPATRARVVAEMSDMIDTTLDVLLEQREGSQARALDLRSLAEALVDDLAAAGHHVALAGPQQEMLALAHPAALKRIAGTLVGNALRYGGNARMQLQHDGSHVLLTVDDDGPGIPADQLELAFRPWVRLAASHARSGHGLGLAIARDLARRDGGEVALSNRPEGGLRATLRLPAAVAGGEATVSAPTRNAWAGSRRQTGARSSSTRWAKFRRSPK